jgi:putative transposase
MTMPRSSYVKEGEEGVYHCISRCVRRAFLCGIDKITGRDLSHRKAWLLERLKFLASVFSIDVCAYAIMENHYHLVIRTRPDLLDDLSNEEIATRWLRLCRRRELSSQCHWPSEKEISLLAVQGDRILELRRRLSSISWFMAMVNEHIARWSNKEDGVKGRFWEGRFKCQVLLDESAIAACMVYVDLNPIRAGIAETPEGSGFTSIRERIRGWQKRRLKSKGSDVNEGTERITPSRGLPSMMKRWESLFSTDDIGLSYEATDFEWLCPVESSVDRRGILDLRDTEYFELVDQSGRMVRSDKIGSIDSDLVPLLMRIGANRDRWRETITSFGSRYSLAGGVLVNLRDFAARLGRRWLKGTTAAQGAFLKIPQEAL